MRTPRLARLVVLLVIATLTGSCATSTTIHENAKRVVAGQPVDGEGMKRAVTKDSKEIETNLEQVRQKIEEAFNRLKTAAEQSWGKKDTKVPSKTVYVKYSNHYKNRVVTDFDHGVI